MNFIKLKLESKNIKALKRFRPDLDKLTDEEAAKIVSALFDVIYKLVENNACLYIRSQNLNINTENNLIEALLNEVNFQSFLHLIDVPTEEVNEKFLIKLSEIMDEFKAKAKASWFEEMGQSIIKEDPKRALYYINDAVFRIEIEKRLNSILGRELSIEILEIYSFFTQCSIYLNTKIQVQSVLQDYPKQLPSKLPQQKELSSLEKLFKNDSQYQSIMQILAANNIIDKVSGQYIDKKKGSLSYLVAIIKSLHNKGYLVRKPQINEITKIALDTFGIKLSVQTVKSAQATDFNLEFIPHCTN